MGTILSRAEAPLGAVQQGLPAAVENIDYDAEARKKERAEEMAKFKAEMAMKREARKEAIASLNRRIQELGLELEKERLERERLERVLEEEGGTRAEVEGLERQVRALKDVAAIGGEMLKIREMQVRELKEKMKAIEETGVQYEKEVENMRRLKGLYDERARALTISHQMELEREKARVVAAETRLEISEEKNRELVEANKELQERISTLDSTVDKNNNEISELRIQLAGKKEELYNATQQMAIINNLFSQVLSDPENLDRVTRVLEEHHTLVNHLTEKGDINDVASVLMTVADKDHILTEEEQDIATNLSKVWKLLVELLGHHNKQSVGEPMPESCYKSIDTPTGPKLVISVSQTFLRLKDLILEKNSLVKEVGRLKDLNCHLEKRLISQESRLAEVAAELHKTWGVVNKLKTQHKALHTHEQVLRYELKHKRLMLNELKQQLEDCREMWQMARSKNNQTEKDWRLLRKEFADRKQQISSAESGYEESPGDSQDEDDSHRLSDDESEVQDFSAVGNGGVLRISAIENLQLNTPDRSNTPDVSEGELPISEEMNSTQEVITDPAATSLSAASPQNNQETSVCTSDDLNEGIILNNSADETVSPSRCLDKVVHSLSTVPEEMTVELEATIEILPWNETGAEEVIEAKEGSEIGSQESLEHKPETSSDIKETEGNAILQSKVGEVASCSHEVTVTPPTQSVNQTTKNASAEEILARREARLKRLEEQCKNLFSKMSHTNKRSDIISNKLVELHEHYGEARCEPSTSQESPAPTNRSSPERASSPVNAGAQGEATTSLDASATHPEPSSSQEETSQLEQNKS